MKTVLIIRSEHRWLQSILQTLCELVDGLADGNKPDFKTLHGIVTYVDQLIHRYHHPKEDRFLLPKLLQRHPASRPLVTGIKNEHQQGDRLFIKLLKALSAYEFTEDLDYSGLIPATYEYALFEKTHAMREECEVLKRAEQFLREEDWEELDARFTDHEDPEFGSEAKRYFRELNTKIVNRIPAPLGLGRS